MLLERYQCLTCKLDFTIGKGHNGHLVKETGYCFSSFYVCRKCGVMHLIRTPAFLGNAIPRAPYVISAQIQPAFDPPRRPNYGCLAPQYGKWTEEYSFEPTEGFFTPLSRGISCLRCGANRSLTDIWSPFFHRCPSCKGKMREWGITNESGMLREYRESQIASGNDRGNGLSPCRQLNTK
jgi:hypothetical protein